MNVYSCMFKLVWASLSTSFLPGGFFLMLSPDYGCYMSSGSFGRNSLKQRLTGHPHRSRRGGGVGIHRITGVGPPWPQKLRPAGGVGAFAHCVSEVIVTRLLSDQVSAARLCTSQILHG